MDLPHPGIKLESPALQADSLPAEPPGKPKNTGVAKSIPSPGDLPDTGIEPGSPTLQVDSLPTDPFTILQAASLDGFNWVSA